MAARYKKSILFASLLSAQMTPQCALITSLEIASQMYIRISALSASLNRFELHVESLRIPIASSNGKNPRYYAFLIKANVDYLSGNRDRVIHDIIDYLDDFICIYFDPKISLREFTTDLIIFFLVSHHHIKTVKNKIH